MNSFGDNIVQFNKQLIVDDFQLPSGFSVLNPYLDNPETIEVMTKFYTKYYSDFKKRTFIIGINPSRHGAGVTGVPFTDTKRLENVCGINMKSAHTHEVSSVFLYDVIREFGGVSNFFENFYINSPFPLAIIKEKSLNTWVNANYYDDNELFKSLKDYMIKTLKINFRFNVDSQNVIVLGKKNANFIEKLNKKQNMFENMTVLEHPRYIEQYKSKEKKLYIDKYLETLYNHVNR